MTLDTKGLLVEVETGVEGEEVVDCGDEVGDGVVGEEEADGLFVFVAATERRPELCWAAEKFRPTRRLITKNRNIRRYITKS